MSKYNEKDYMLTPCRFAPGGWKYVKRDTLNKYLNHPNKVNNLGMGAEKVFLIEESRSSLPHDNSPSFLSRRRDDSGDKSFSDVKSHY
mmetsp:Transcript_33716/g.24749  ORF Transcript_33716/g.24749 Transcript_33716/m.24749 type:complete len:88 (-) Transcript_33716:491-754(-)